MKLKGREKYFLYAALFFCIAAWMPMTAYGVPMKINYQGYLTDADGNPVDGTVNLTLSGCRPC